MRKALIDDLRFLAVLYRYSPLKSSEKGSGPIDTISEWLFGSSGVHSRHPNRRGSWNRRHRPSAKTISTWSCLLNWLLSPTSRRLPDIPKWMIRVPIRVRRSRYLPRRLTSVNRCPGSTVFRVSGTGQRNCGCRITMVLMTSLRICGSIPRLVVSTSGSSGISSLFQERRGGSWVAPGTAEVRPSIPVEQAGKINPSNARSPSNVRTAFRSAAKPCVRIRMHLLLAGKASQDLFRRYKAVSPCVRRGRQ